MIQASADTFSTPMTFTTLLSIALGIGLAARRGQAGDQCAFAVTDENQSIKTRIVPEQPGPGRRCNRRDRPEWRFGDGLPPGPAEQLREPLVGQ